MGEYAKYNGRDIKIGTCEDMYYLRFEDRGKVRHISGNVNPAVDREAAELRFRLPFLDEDDCGPGNYEEYNRSLRLCDCGKIGSKLNYCRDFADESLAEKPGTVQLHHESGLLVNVPCYHGIRLPDLGECKTFWNGKSYSLVLSSLRGVMDNGTLKLLPVVRCRWCDEAWRYDWANIWDYIPEATIEQKMFKDRLQPYAKAWAKPCYCGTAGVELCDYCAGLRTGDDLKPGLAS